MINLVLSEMPIDEVPGQVALALVFEDVRPLRGATSLIDWRLNGRLSDLIQQDKLAGKFSESLMMPSQGRLSSRDVLVFGLGESGSVDEKKFEKGVSLLIEKVNRLKTPEIVISLGDFAKDFMSWRTLLRNFVSTLASSKRDCQVLCAEESRLVSEAKKRNMDFGSEVHLSYA